MNTSPGDDDVVSFAEGVSWEHWFPSVEIKIWPSFTSTVGAEEYRTKRSFGFDPEASVCLCTFASTPKN